MRNLAAELSRIKTIFYSADYYPTPDEEITSHSELATIS